MSRTGLGWLSRKGKEAKQAEVEIPAGPLPATLLNETDGSELILAPAGTFLRGSLERQGDPDERPQREIHLDAFYIARYPVTNRQHRKFVEQTGHRAPHFWSDSQFNQDEQPVVGVSWVDTEAYCRWAGLRLPTEAEWEKAAGWDEEKKLKRWWPWGDTEPDPERANYANNLGRTTPVGSYPLGASACGCHDLAGNVWEWVQDWYDYSYYENSPAQNPTGPERARYKVLRGGSFRRPSGYITTTYRYWYSADFEDVETGFRCAKSALPVSPKPKG